MPFCPNCGRSSDGQFCIDCGTRLTQPAAGSIPIQNQTKSSLKSKMFSVLIMVIALCAGLAVSPYIMAPRVQTTVEQQTVTVPPVTITTPGSTVTSVITQTASVTETKTNQITYNPTSNALFYASVTSVYTPLETTYYQTSQNRQSCDPSYPTVCIPSPPPDLDCKDISYRNFQVLPPDPHHFDGDHDGIGCET